VPDVWENVVMQESAAEPADLTASLAAFGAPPSRAIVTVARPSPGRRLTRALKAGGLFWAIAAGCVFIPGLHFVLVPSFLVIGVVTGLRHLRDQEIVSGVRGACPRCGLEQVFAVGNRLTPSWSLDCPACHTTLALTLDTGTTPPA
jgi:hypothetical protein